MRVMQLSLFNVAPMNEGAKIVQMGNLDEVAARQGLSDLFIDADLAWCRKCPMAEICDKVTCHWDEEEDDFML